MKRLVKILLTFSLILQAHRKMKIAKVNQRRNMKTLSTVIQRTLNRSKKYLSQFSEKWN